MVTAQQTKKKMPRKPFILAAAVLLLLLGAAGIWYVKAYDPSAGPGIFPPCLFHEVTGLWCTGCGMTRALHFILNGEFYQGFRMNPLAILSAPFLAWALVVVLWRAYKGKPMPNIPTWVPWTALAVILLYTVARNLPWEPFSWLAPTALPWVRQ